MSGNQKEAVNHPDHYGGKNNPFEAIKVIEALDHGFSFCIGNTLKYLLRAGKKDPAKAVEDLKKSVWYLRRAIADYPAGYNSPPYQLLEKLIFYLRRGGISECLVSAIRYIVQAVDPLDLENSCVCIEAEIERLESQEK